MLEDVRHERFPIRLLSVTFPDMLRQSNFRDLEKNIVRKTWLLKSYTDREFCKICCSIIDRHVFPV